MNSRESVRRLSGGILAGVLIVASWGTGNATPPPQRVDLQFTQTDVEVVLTALASTVGFNLVLGTSVEGEVDVHLTGVDWENALNTIVGAHGFRYFWSDNVLVVVSATDVASSEGLEHRVIKLKYADPGVVKNALVNVLSGQGKIELLGASAESAPGTAPTGRSPVIILSEAPHRIDQVLSVIDQLDVPMPQFEIQVKFVETDIDDKTGVGVSWPTRVSADISDRIQNTDGSASTSTATGPAAELMFPSSSRWRFGTLNVGQVSGFMEFLRQNGNSRLLSDPSVTVLENQEAYMEVSTTIPIQTFNRFTENGISEDIIDYQDLDVGISLTVTPRLNDAGKITLDVEPVVEEITGYTGPADNQRPITAKRTVKTSVRVRDGETLVIGGLVKETEFQTKSRVFLLGDIPILGRLFTHTSKESKKTDLLMFITPHIVTDTM